MGEPAEAEGFQCSVFGVQFSVESQGKAPSSGLSATFSPAGEKDFILSPRPFWGRGLG